MAAISRVYTVQLVAKMLGRDEDLIWSLSDQLEPEDGRLWIYDVDDGETLAFDAVIFKVLIDAVYRLLEVIGPIGWSGLDVGPNYSRLAILPAFGGDLACGTRLSVP